MPQIENGESGKTIIFGILVTSIAVIVSNALPFICFLALPQAGLFTRVRFGRYATVVCLAEIILIAILSNGILIDMFFLTGLFLMGYVMGESFRRRLSVELTVILPTVVALLSYFFGLYFHAGQLNLGMVAFMEEYVGKNLELTLKVYESVGMSTESIQLFSDNFDRIRHDLVRLIPAITISLTLTMAWLNLLLSRSLQVISRLQFYDFRSLNQWKTPEHLVWFAIGCGLLLILSENGLRLISISSLLVLMIVYFFQGIAIVAFYFEKKRFPRLLKIFMYSIIAVQQILLFFIIGLGFFDMWMNFRKLDRKEMN
ncbi:MAG: DUF2232 domain-containing protein [Pseudomonadota bacterium]